MKHKEMLTLRQSLNARKFAPVLLFRGNKYSPKNWENRLI